MKQWEGQQIALEHIAELCDELAEHAVAAAKLVRSEPQRRINQPTRAA